jgi:outer membrane lipase/esterase
MKFTLTKAALAVAAMHCSVAAAAEFSDAYFFGDSLTDSGAFVNHPYNSIPALAPLQPIYAASNNKFTSTGGKVWAEFLTQSLTGKTLQANNPLNPANAPASGTNFAQGGAQVHTTPGVGGQPLPQGNSPAIAALSVKQQVDTYLAQKAGAADPNAVYTVYAGANDIFYWANFLQTAQSNPAALPALISITSGPVKSIMQQVAAGTLSATQGSQAMLQQSTADLRDQVARLQAAGAKYVMVPMLPDMGKTPYGLSNPAAGGSLSTLSNGYNLTLQNTLAASGIGVIPVDTVSLTNDIQANPAKYGLTNSTTPGCAGVGASASLLCTAMVAGGDAYMFADGVHPTQATHQIVAAYAGNVVTNLVSVAPAMANAMQTLALANGDNLTRVIDNHSRSLEGTRNFGGDYRVFMDLSANPVDIEAFDRNPDFNSYNSSGNVTVGIDMLHSPTAFAGFALGRHSYGGKFDAVGAKVDALETSLTFYGKAFVGPAYLGWQLGFGDINYTHVDSVMQVAPISDAKHGETSGDRKLGRISAGIPYQIGMLTLTPKLDLTQQNLHISGFADSGSNISRTWFGKQDVKSLAGGIGLALQGSFRSSDFTLRPYLEGSYKREFKDDPRSVMVGMGNTSIGYKATLAEIDTSWGNIDAGVNFDLSKSTTLGINYAKTLSLDHVDYSHYGMSISGRF